MIFRTMNVFIPEDGDEVVVCFKNNDLVVCGRVYRVTTENVLTLNEATIYRTGGGISIGQSSNFEIELEEILAIGHLDLRNR